MNTKCMKKGGFTLSEVLLVLSVIGVVAALTIPTLIQKMADEQNKTAWKKIYSTLSQATISLMNDNGGSMKCLCGDCTTLYQHQCMMDKYAQYLNYIKKCNGGTIYGVCFSGSGYPYIDNLFLLNGTTHLQINSYVPYLGDTNSGLILSNGSMVTFNANTPNCITTTEGIPNMCGSINVDVNGLKGPNTIGKDIFAVNVQESGIKPVGAGTYYNTCSTSSTGFGCAAEYLYK